ncbi:MAG TPA: DMT family transporter [Gammaproteobacteria bacterium]
MSVPASYLGVILIWATTPLAIKWSSEGFDFSFAVFARMLIGMLLCMALLPLLRVAMPWDRRSLVAYAGAGGVLFVALLSTYWAARYVPSGLISVIYGLTPLITAILAARFLRERSLTPIKLLGMVLGFSGLALIFVSPSTLELNRLEGLAMLLFAVTTQAAGAIFLKRHSIHLHPLALNTGSLLVAVPLFLLVWLLGATESVAVSEAPPHAQWAVLYLAIFGTVVGFNLYYYLLKHLPTSVVALITLITPVLAMLMGVYLNGEEISARVALGAGIILLGLACHQGGEWFIDRRSASRL